MQVRTWVETFAEWLRFYSQCLLGAVIFLCLICRVGWRFRVLPELLSQAGGIYWSTVAVHLTTFLSQPTLAMVADGLAVSAGIDLAYMLTTEGPDEAIVPLITGLASAVLLIASNDERLDLYRIFGLAVLIMLIIVLYNFAEKKKLMNKKKQAASIPPPPG